jgi:hypothetical protein
MPRVTYADEVDAHFGIPWTDDLKFEKGELACALSEDEIDALPQGTGGDVESLND